MNLSNIFIKLLLQGFFHWSEDLRKFPFDKNKMIPLNFVQLPPCLQMNFDFLKSWTEQGFVNRYLFSSPRDQHVTKDQFDVRVHHRKQPFREVGAKIA